MPVRNDVLSDRLSRYSELKITVTGRKTKRAISIPVWFVFEDDKLYLLPVQGSDTQWFKNVQKNPALRIDARGEETEIQTVSITDPEEISSVVEKFREKYGSGEIKKYYSKFDVALMGQIR